MKNNFFLILILIVAGCSNNDSNDKTATKETTETKPQEAVASAIDAPAKKLDNVSPPAPDKQADTIIYAGVFAKWNSPDGAQYDGTYDHTSRLFVFCSTQHCQEVDDSSQIVLQEFGSCDTLPGERIKVFIRIDTSFHSLPGIVRVTDNKALLQLNGSIREVRLGAQTIKQINRVNNTPVRTLRSTLIPKLDTVRMQYHPAQKIEAQKQVIEKVHVQAHKNE